MRVLFSSVPAWGHVHPLLPLAQAFVARGDDVVWAIAGEECGRLEANGVRTAAAGLPQSRLQSVVAAVYAELAPVAAEERPELAFARIFGLPMSTPMLEDLLPIARRFDPALVVRDLAEFGEPVVAAAIGIPALTHSFGEIVPASRVARAGDAVAPLWSAQGLAPRPYGGSFDHLYLDIYPPSLQHGDRSHVARSQSIRPPAFVPSSGSSAVLAFTSHEESPLVYLTFGTVFSDAPTVGAVLSAVRELDVRVVVTVGPDTDPDVLGAQPGNVHVARYIPQHEILPSCAAVVSHAGSGTFLAALGAGLPQLCLPQGADQFLNAEACERSGAGIALRPGEAGPDRVRQSVERLLSDPTFRDRAVGVSAEIAAMPSPAEVADLLAAQYG